MIKQGLVELIVGNDLPFAFAEYSGLNVFVKLCTAKRVKFYSNAKKVVQQMISKSTNCIVSATKGVAGNDLIESFFKPMIYNMYKQYQVNEAVDYAPPILTIVSLVARTTSAFFLELPPISAESELTGYLPSECELFGTDENATILTWWKSNAVTRYPQLSKFTRSILAVSATSVPSECTFSTSGRVISEYRSTLHTDTVQLINKFTTEL